MQKKKWILWIVLGLAALILVFFTLFFWDTFVMYIAPQTVLRSALNNAMDELESRYYASPVRIIAGGYDQDGRNTTQLLLNTVDDTGKTISYDMNVKTDLSSNQVLAKGMVTFRNDNLDVSVYLDKQFAALTSDSLLKGGYYGLTYDTFGSDLRSIPLISFLVPDAAMVKWESSVAKLQEKMNQSYALPKIPDISVEQMKKITLAVLAFHGEISKEEILVNNQWYPCYQLTYKASSQQLGNLFGYLFDANAPVGGQLTANFYLYEKSLVKAELFAVSENDRASYVLTLGQNAAVDDIAFGMSKAKEGEYSTFSFSVSTRNAGSGCEETVCLNDTVISYFWDNSTGDMRLTLPGRETISLNLSETKNGFRVITQDFAKLMGWSTQKSIDCSMTIGKGTSVAVPGYKNLDQWSLDDLVVLLGSIGSLIGIHIG